MMTQSEFFLTLINNIFLQRTKISQFWFGLDRWRTNTWTHAITKIHNFSSPVMVGGGGKDGHESEARAQEDPASDVQEAVRTSPRPRPGAHHVPAISSSPVIKYIFLSSQNKIEWKNPPCPWLLARPPRHQRPFLALTIVIIPEGFTLFLAESLRLER